MTIHVSKDVENAINSAVLSGQFASADDMVAALVQEYTRSHPMQAQPVVSDANAGLGSIGAMRDAADELDEIVADAYGRRRQEQAGLIAAETPKADHRPIWERIEELRKNVPAEEWEKLPVDGSAQLDHYIYGSPKRPTT